jgi:hypothetical protein
LNVTTTIKLRDHFATPFLADGNAAMLFRCTHVEPVMARGDNVILDLEGIENMTDSFSNACFSQLFVKHQGSFGTRLKFKACTPLIKGFVLSALSMSERRGN